MDFVGAAIRVTEMDEPGWLEDESTGGEKKRKNTSVHYTRNDNKNTYDPRNKKETYDTRRLNRRNDNTISERSNRSDRWRCGHCRGRGHVTWKCPEYLKLTVKERMEFVRREERCITCLAKHEGKKCASTYTCFTCKTKHNSTLCPRNERNPGGVKVNINAYEQFEPADEEEDNLEVSLHPSRGQNK
jgi:hypothetical protein